MHRWFRRRLVDANPEIARRARGSVRQWPNARASSDQGAREQAIQLYRTATAFAARAGAVGRASPPLRRAVSQDYFDKGSRVYRNVAQAITFFETSLRYDPPHRRRSSSGWRQAREKLEKIDTRSRNVAAEPSGEGGP